MAVGRSIKVQPDRFFRRAVKQLTVVLAVAAFAGLPQKAISNPVDTYYDQVYKLINSGDLSAALSSVDRRLSADRLKESEITEGLRLRGSILLRLEKYDRALANLSSALEFSRGDVWILWQRCWIHAVKARFSSARRDCDLALARALDNFGKTRSGRDGAQGARADLKGAVAANAELMKRTGYIMRGIDTILSRKEDIGVESDYSLSALLAELYLLAGEPAEAKRWIERALLLTRDAPDALQAHIVALSAEIEFSTGDFQSAGRKFERASSMSRDRGRHAYNACAAYLIVGAERDALRACQVSFDENGWNPASIDAYGSALLNSGNEKQAKEVFSEGLSRHPNNQYLLNRFKELGDQ